MITIRRAEMEDIRAILLMGREMVDASNFAHLGYDVRHFGEYCLYLLTSDNSVIFLAEQDKEVIGAILCTVAPGAASPTLIGYEQAFYVRPARRSLKAAQMLIRSYVEWATDLGAKRICSGNSAGSPDAGYRKLLEREGFDFAGSLMYMNVKG